MADTIVAILDEVGWHEIRVGKCGLLWDLRRAELSAYRFEDMTRLHADDDEAASRTPVPVAGPAQGRLFRIAAVFRGDANYPTLRLWESSGDRSDDLERRSFDDIDDARRWIAGV